MASIFDNLKNLFGSKPEIKQINRKEAPIVYYNNINTSYQQKQDTISFQKRVIQKML